MAIPNPGIQPMYTARFLDSRTLRNNGNIEHGRGNNT